MEFKHLTDTELVDAASSIQGELEQRRKAAATEQERPIGLEDIRPGMSADDKRRAWREIGRMVEEEG